MNEKKRTVLFTMHINSLSFLLSRAISLCDLFTQAGRQAAAKKAPIGREVYLPLN